MMNKKQQETYTRWLAYLASDCIHIFHSVATAPIQAPVKIAVARHHNGLSYILGGSLGKQ